MPEIIINSEEYKKGITRLMDARSSEAVGNRIPAHAAALFELFFERAKKEVVIFCENLNPTVFEQSCVENAILKAVSKNGVRVRVLLQRDRAKTEFFDELSKQAGFFIARANPADSDNIPYNFSVMDREAYRFEKDRSTTEAFAKMYHPEEAKVLYQHFEYLWERRQQ